MVVGGGGGGGGGGEALTPWLHTTCIYGHEMTYNVMHMHVVDNTHLTSNGGLSWNKIAGGWVKVRGYDGEEG